MILDKIESKGPSIEGFTPVFLDIIRPFYGRISVDFIREWQVFLDKGSLNKEEIQKMVNTGKAFLTKEAATYNHNDRLWAETMIFISLYRLNDRLVEDEQMPWPLDFDTNNSGSIPSLILTKVTELYNLWRVEPEAYPCARAYAYCLAVEGALGIKLYEHQTKSSKLIKEGLSDVRMKEFDPFRDYLNCAFIGTGQFASNYLSRFVIDYTVNRSPAGASLDGQSYIEHYKLIDLGRVKLNKDRISVMMVGLSGSGKTSIIKGLYEAIYRGGYNNSPLKQLSTRKDENTVQANQAYKFLNRAVGTREDVYILEGEITINNSDYFFEMVDSRGGLTETDQNKIKNVDLWSDYEKEIADTDMLMVVIDPSCLMDFSEGEFAIRVTGSIAAKLDFLFSKSRHKPIGIVLSKFDEYGAIMNGTRRLIMNDNHKDLFINYLRSGSTTDWDKLVNALTAHQYFTPDMKKTLSALLEKLYGLLNIVVAQYKHPAVNLYLTKVEVEEGMDFHRTGVPSILEDFRDYNEWLFNQRLPDLEYECNYNVSENYVELRWSNPFHITSDFIVYRKSLLEAEFVEIGRGNQVSANKSLSYTDKSVGLGKSYTYKVVLANNAEVLTCNVDTKPQFINNATYAVNEISAGSSDVYIDLSWQASTDEYPVTYEINRRVSNWPGESWLTPKSNLSANNFSDYEVKKGRNYIYTVKVTKAGNPLLNNGPSSIEVQVNRTCDWKFWLVVALIVLFMVGATIFLFFYGPWAES